MNHKKIKQLAYLCLLSAFLTKIPGTVVQFSSYYLQPVTQNVVFVTARANKTQWIYKTVDGKVYRRLYDLTAQKYLTDWELVK